MPKNKLFQSAVFCFITFVFCLSALPQNLTVRDIMREPSIAGMRPDSERLSPDGKTVVFSWNAEGKEPRNLYAVSTSGGEPRILVSAEQNYETRTPAPESKLNYGLTVRDDFAKAREKNLFGVEFSPDSKRILFLQNTDIYVLDLSVKDAKPRRITRTQGSENSARWISNDQILYSSGGNFYVLNLRETALIQITKEANPAAFVSIFNATASEDGKLAAYVVSDGSKQRALFVPNYLDEFVQSPTSRRGFTEQKVFVTKTDGSLEKPFELKLPKAEGAGYVRGVDWAADNRSLIVDRVDKDTKRRQIFYVYNVGDKDEKTITVTEETDAKWIASLSRIVEPNPKNAAEILFASEKDGFNHLYLATLERSPRESNVTDAGFTSEVRIKQLTNGKWQVEWAEWNFKGNDIVYLSTEKGTADRTFSSIQIKKDDDDYAFDSNMLRGLEARTGSSMKTNPQMERETLLYEVSKWNAPSELYATTNLNGPGPGTHYTYKLTKTTPESFLKTKWSEPKFVDIPTRDGKVVKSKVYLPSNFNQSKKYPMVFFVHGAGYLQNTINGWNNYYREFMFNDMLTRKGYVVLDIDYRGSAGYGRDWRTDVYDFLGGKDYDDHLDAINYAVKNYAVNAQKIGVYGGSYGGFMAEMLVMRAPDKIAAAAALRPVADWKNYFASSPIYTVERLGFPDKNAEAYKRSSPIAYAENLRKPLLILHGLVDDNVHAQDSMQLVEKLIRLEKTPYFEAMFYPSESHAFTRPTSWADEYERIFAFFEKHLKN